MTLTRLTIIDYLDTGLNLLCMMLLLKNSLLSQNQKKQLSCKRRKSKYREKEKPAKRTTQRKKDVSLKREPIVGDLFGRFV